MKKLLLTIRRLAGRGLDPGSESGNSSLRESGNSSLRESRNTTSRWCSWLSATGSRVRPGNTNSKVAGNTRSRWCSCTSATGSRIESGNTTSKELGNTNSKVAGNTTSKGFTLIELLIAITIFVSFLVVVANSYIAIVRAQVTANETRQMYSEMRNFVDFVNGEMREGSIDYFCYAPPLMLENMDSNSDALTRCGDTHDIAKGDNLRTISRDGFLSSIIYFDKNTTTKETKVMVQKFRKTSDTWQPESGYETAQSFAFSNLQVKDLHFDIYPKVNPAQKVDNNNLQNQLQPMVMMTMEVASNNPSVKFDLNFQTMITSRSL